MSICSNVDVEEVLKMAFSPDKNPDHCTLDRIEERTLMLLEICRSVKTQYNSRISNLIDASEGRLINQGRGLYETLPRLMAFSDPQKKKITFFLKLASDAGVINIKDPENLVPIMDYHMQRVLLRTGCIEVTDSGLREALVHKTRQGSDEPIRSLCIKALRSLAEYSGKDLLAMNDILWPLGRSCCHETTLCKDKYCAKEPCTLTQTVDIESHTTCIFDEVCKGSRDDTYRSLFEPIVETHYY